MLPKTFLTQLLPSRIAEAARRVQMMIWQPLPHRLQVEQTVSYPEHLRFDELPDTGFTPISDESFNWGPKYAQRWFRLSLPDEALQSPEPLFLSWGDQAEATLYVDGMPYYGFDVAHHYCPLPAGLRTCIVESVCIRTGIWVPQAGPGLEESGSRYTPPRLWHRNDLAWDVYYDLKVLLELLEAEHLDWQPPGAGLPPKALTDPVRHSPPVFRASPLFRRCCARLDQAVDLLDAEGLESCAKALKALYRDLPAGNDSLKATLTGHAHIDLVWLWPENVGVFKAVHTWSTQIRLLEKYPEFRFSYSQPASYEAVAQRSPKLHQRALDLIQAKQWETTGASYVESDTLMPCGEALLRSLRMGQEAFIALRGKPASVFWLPDVFGYSGCMPQLLRGFGVRGFYTTKLSWSAINRFPHTSFRWRGIDGSEVVAQVELVNGYNETLDVRRLRESTLHHQQAAEFPEFLVPVGYGDGGGGTTEEMCERARRMANLAGVPQAEWGGIESFFDRLDAVRETLPTVAGELMLELHRGVFTTHGRLKAAFRGLERALQTQEAAYALCGLDSVSEHAWKRLIFAQFHDYIPGSSIWEVYAEAIPELEKLAEEARLDAQNKLSDPTSASTKGWFNPLPVERPWITEDQCFLIPPLNAAPETSLRQIQPPQFIATPTELRSDRVSAKFDDKGGLAALKIDGQTIALTGNGHQLCAYRDQPAVFDAWDVDRNSLVHSQPAVLTGQVQVQMNPTSASVCFPMSLGQNHILVKYSLQAGESVLRIHYDVDWQEPTALLKAVFSTTYQGSQARYGAPFGSICRSQWPGYTREEAQWEVPASRWMVVADDSQQKGLAIITEAKYGFTVRDGVVGVSLLRSALVTEADLHPEIRDMPNRPQYADLGRHQISLALGRYAHDLPTPQQPAMLAESLFTPCLSYQGPALSAGLVEIADAPSLIPSWVEPQGPCSWLLRLSESLGQSGTASIRLAPGWEAASVCLGHPILQRDCRPLELTENGWLLEYKSYEICSVLINKQESASDNVNC